MRAKFEHLLYSLTLHWCSRLLFASSFVTPFASRKTWCGRTIYSWSSNILQSKIKAECSSAKAPYVVNQLRRICESIYRFMCLYPNSQAILKSYLIAHISTILFKATPIWIEKLFIYLPLLFLNTTPPSALLGLYF